MSDPRHRRVATLVTGFLWVMLAALGGYLVYIYVYSSEALSARAAKQHHMRIPIRPMRGNILDARLRVLAGSDEVQSVFADPKRVEDAEAAAGRVSRALGLDVGEVLMQLTDRPDRRFVWLKRRVSPEEAQAVRDLGLPGVALVNEGARVYPNRTLAAHVLGCVGIDEQGLEGIEQMFDERLRGREGEAYVLADRRRRPIWAEAGRFVPAEDGQHLVLTLDATVQGIAEEALAEAVTKFRAVSGSAIVMEPATGAILAMANVPTYDPNRYSDFPAEARRNRAITDTFPPGSCCKPFIAAAAIETGVVKFGEVIYCEDGYWAAAKLHDASHRYGNLTFEEGVQKSSNIMMAKLGVRLGNERLHDTLVRFGFGRKTGVWLPGENGGVVFGLPRWTRLSTTRVAFGQEFTATPLQLVTAFAAIANGGKLVRPKILRGVLNSRGQAAADLEAAEVVGQAIQLKTARQMIDRVLVGVVEQGTGTPCRIPGYRVFGKTGTAQKVDPETKAVSHTRYMASFLAGAPADNPRVVVGVIVDEPDKSIGYYGGTVAAPAAKKILEQVLPYLGVRPTEAVAKSRETHLVNEKVTD